MNFLSKIITLSNWARVVTHLRKKSNYYFPPFFYFLRLPISSLLEFFQKDSAPGHLRIFLTLFEEIFKWYLPSTFFLVDFVLSFLVLPFSLSIFCIFPFVHFPQDILKRIDQAWVSGKYKISIFQIQTHHWSQTRMSVFTNNNVCIHKQHCLYSYSQTILFVSPGVAWIWHLKIWTPP